MITMMTETETETVLTDHAIAGCFPALSDREYRDLKASLLDQGQLTPIWTYQNQIIDGRHRHRACLELGLTPWIREWDGETSIVGLVLDLNLLHRQLDASQRAMVAANLANLGQGRPAGTMQICKITLDEAAARLGVSKRLVGSAREVMERGVPGLAEAVARGEVRLTAAAAVAGLPEEEQAGVVEGGAKAMVARAAAIRRGRKAVNAGPKAEEPEEGEVEGAKATAATGARDEESRPTGGPGSPGVEAEAGRSPAIPPSALNPIADPTILIADLIPAPVAGSLPPVGETTLPVVELKPPVADPLPSVVVSSVSALMPPLGWLESLTLRAKLADPTAFDQEAIFYYVSLALLGTTGPFAADAPQLKRAEKFLLVSQVDLARSLRHPDDWTLCFRCRGKATDGTKPCRLCHGQGFWITQIPYSAPQPGKAARKKVRPA
jgi:hypothetical protein